MGKEPRKVKEIPKGYEFSHKDEVTGRDIYKIKTSTPEVKIPVKKTTTVVSTGKPRLLRPPLPKRIPPTINEDYVFMDSLEPVVDTAATKITNIPLNEGLRLDRKLQPPIHPNVDYYQYPDANAGYSKATPMYFDKETQQPIDILKSIGADGKYNPTYINDLKANDAYKGTIKQGTPRVTTDPTKTNMLPDSVIDKSGTKGATSMETTGFKKGGVVGKIKGYDDGGNVQRQQFLNGLNSDYYGVVGQNDPYAKKRQEEQLKNPQLTNGHGGAKGESWIDPNTGKETTQNGENFQAGAKVAGAALGSYGSAYYNSQTSENKGEATRNAAMAGISNAGPIGGAIGGSAAIGDKIGKPIKAKKERLDSNGNLVNEKNARQTAIGASFLSPSKALAVRSSYEGGWTDVTGKGYTKSLEDKAKAQLEEVKAANMKSRQEQAIANRDAGNLNADVNTLYDLKGASFDENQNLILSNDQQFDKNRPYYNKGGVVGKVKQMCADGGVIKGKGTAKSDSIKAKVKPGSFIVPAENTKIAEELREKLLMKAPKAKANLNQKGGEEVKLSNKEHLFTPEEKEELLERGVNVNLLAPNAHNKEEMNEPKSKHNVKEEKKEYMQFPNILGYKEGGPVKGTKYGNVTWDGKNWVSADGNKYSEEGGKKFTEGYNQSVQKAKSNEASRKTSEINVYKRKLYEAKNEGRNDEANRLQNKINELSGIKDEAKNDVKSTDKSESKASGQALKAPSLNGKTVANKNTYTPPSTEYSPNDEITIPDGNMSPNEKAKLNADEEKSAIQAAALNKSLHSTTITNTPTTSKSSRPGILSKIGSVDPTMFVGAGQTALGLNMLGKEKRPIDNIKLDATYNANVNRAIEDAKFGLTPEQKFLAEQDIQNSLNDTKSVGLNYAGGSGVQAFNTNRAAINDAWKAKLGLKTADTELRMQKQQYADQQAAERANVLAANRRMLFGDAMNAFQQKQQSGADLISAGLNNTIGAYRFRQDQKARQAADEARGYSLNNYGKDNV